MPTATAPTDVLDPKQLLNVLLAVRKGDFSARLPDDYTGVAGKIADALNETIETNARLMTELARTATEVGREGRTSRRAQLSGGRGAGRTASSRSTASSRT